MFLAGTFFRQAASSVRDSEWSSLLSVEGHRSYNLCCSKRLVQPCQLLGSSVRCVSFGGREEEFPLAKVSVDSPYFSGEMTCLSLRCSYC